MKKALIALTALAAVALPVVALVPADTVLASSKTQADVGSLAGSESKVLGVLKGFRDTSGWKAEFKSAEAAQQTALARVNADLAPPPQSHSNSSSTFPFTDPNGVAYTVTLKEVIDPAQGADNQAPTAGDRFVAAVFTITNKSRSGTTSPPWNNANINASVVGADEQTYTPAFVPMTECTNFDTGSYQLGPGESSTGCVAFALPSSVKVADVKWSPGGPSGSSFGEWKIV